MDGKGASSPVCLERLLVGSPWLMAAEALSPSALGRQRLNEPEPLLPPVLFVYWYLVSAVAVSLVRSFRQKYNT